MKKFMYVAIGSAALLVASTAHAFPWFLGAIIALGKRDACAPGCH